MQIRKVYKKVIDDILVDGLVEFYAISTIA